jgi:sulfur carrier protein ThiS|tara:strand:+ start:2507 stop:2740 length:234 start_codon:yes stop_codon:yes gene_type:complete
MQVEVRVTGQLIDYFSGTHVNLDEGASVEQALVVLEIPAASVGLVSVNGDAVPREKRPQHGLVAGDQMVVMAPLTGG